MTVRDSLRSTWTPWCSTSRAPRAPRGSSSTCCTRTRAHVSEHCSRERSGDPEVARAVAQVRELIGEPDADAVRDREDPNTWLDEDRKATPLKTLQGVIWSEGFARGDLVSHFYDDVVPALRAWHAAGVRLLRLLVRVRGRAARLVHAQPRGRPAAARRRACTTPRTRAPSRSRSRTAVSRRSTGIAPATASSSSPTGRASWTRPVRRAGTPSGSGGPGSRTTSRASATTRRRGRSTRSPSATTGSTT